MALFPKFKVNPPAISATPASPKVPNSKNSTNSNPSGFSKLENSNIRADFKNPDFLADCPSCRDRHILGQSCPEKSKDWMSIVGNRIVMAVSVNLDTWALSPRKEAILEALNRFDEAWGNKDEKLFKEVVSEIDSLLDVAKP